MPQDTLPLVLVVAAPVLTFAAIRWRRALLMALPFLVTLNGVPLALGDSAIRLDQLAACVLLMPLLIGWVAGRRRIRLDSTSWWLVALLINNVASSILNSPVPGYSLRQCLNLASAWIIYVLLVNFLEHSDELEAFLTRVLWAAIVASAVGVVAFVLALSGVRVGGAEVSASAAEHLTHAYGAYGTMIEPNIFGSFTAANLLLATALLVAGSDGTGSDISKKLLRWTVALTTMGLIVSFTRAAWLGTLVGLLCLAVIGGRALRVRFRIGRILAILVASGVVMATLLLLPGDTGAFFRFKVANLVNLASQTAIVRWISSALALEQTAQHPLIGWGTFTFAPLTAQGGDFQQFENWRNLWIGNYLLLALHDTGVIGLSILIGVFVSVLKKVRDVLETMSREDSRHASRVWGLTAAFASFLVAFLATSGFSLGYSWLVVGLLAAYCRVGNERRAETP